MKTVLVTGANGNLGSAVVKVFSEKEWRVIAVISPRAKSEMFTNLNNVDVISTDAASEQEVLSSIQQIVDKHIQIDAAVLTIGGYAEGKIAETTTDKIHAMLQLNFFTAWHFVKPLFEQMISKQSGRIVLIGSQAGINLTEGTYAAAYSIAKTAVTKLASLINESGKKKNVFCHLISPTTLDTPQNRKAMPAADFSQWQKPETVALEIYNVINR